MIIRLVLAAAIAAPCVGCASVTRGTTENISISSTPAGATAELSGLDNPTACVTPCVVVAKRSADITVTVTKEGYEPQVIPLTKEIPGSRCGRFRGQSSGRWAGRDGRRCRHRRRAGSQAESGHRDPAAGRAAGPPAAAAKTAADAAELTGSAGAASTGDRRCARNAVLCRSGPACSPEITRRPRLCDLKSRKGLAYLS